jgi:ketosteroid isomerase-like protein
MTVHSGRKGTMRGFCSYALAGQLLLASASAGQQDATENEVRDLVVAFNDAYARNDLETYFDYYDENATQWWESGRVSVADYKKQWYALIEGGGGVEKNELSDIRVQVGPSGDTAVATYRVDVVTRATDGTRSNESAWETDVWFRRGGRWKVVHLHYNSRPAEE